MTDVRGRARRVGDVARASLMPQLWRGGVVVPAHWWVGRSNFGDDLTRWLLPRYGILPIRRPVDQARVLGVGSLLETLPPDYPGIVWGSGLLWGEARSLPNATIVAVRGPLTRDLVGAPSDVALGDPGLLIGRHFRREAARWKVGIVPHLDHRSHPALDRARRRADAHVIEVGQSAPRAIAQIQRCEAIVTTSLHGLIVADALGIPAVWTSLDPPHPAGNFKFHDYEAAITPGGSRFSALDERVDIVALAAGASPVPSDRVESLISALEATIPRLRAALADAPRFPHGLVPMLRAAG